MVDKNLELCSAKMTPVLCDDCKNSMTMIMATVVDGKMHCKHTLPEAQKGKQ